MAKIFYSTDKNAPGGSDKQVQFNDNGLMTGDANMVFDKTSANLTVGGSGVDGKINLKNGTTGSDHVRIEKEGTTGGRITLFNGAGLSAICLQTGEGDPSYIDTGSNVGISTTAPASKLSVAGGVGIGATYAAGTAAPANGLIVEGNVGVGNNNPSVALDVTGAAKVSSNLTMTGGNLILTAPNIISLNSGGTGWRIYKPTSGSAQAVTIQGDGNAINNAAFNNGGAVIGGTYAGGNTTAPTHGLLVQGSVGIGTTTPQSKLDVEGGVAIGATYSGTTAAPANGLIVEGRVGVGTSAPAVQLHVYSTANTAFAKLESDGADSTPYLQIENDAQTWTMMLDGATSDILKIRNSSTGSDKVAITPAGNVGIGTTAPNVLLANSATQTDNGATGPNASAINWRVGGAGWNTTLANSTDAAAANGTLIKIARTVSDAIALGVYYGANSPALIVHGGGNVEGSKFRITPEGGYAIKVVAGENLVAGEVVYIKQTDGADGKVWKNPTGGDMPIGVVYAAASANADVWVVTSGIVSVLPEAAVTLTRGYIIASSTSEAGRVNQSATIAGVTDHWTECGHLLDTGAGAGVATRAIVHFN